MWNKLKLITNTVIHLKWIQVFYQIYYKVRNRVTDPISFGSLKGFTPLKEPLKFTNFTFHPDATSIDFASQESIKVSFLNLSHQFEQNIDWNYDAKGKLWTYNLNYFDFLFDSSLETTSGKELIKLYCHDYGNLKDGLEPYPISLRGINWIKFLSMNNIRDSEIDQCLYKQFKILESNVEYHILANHLLENAFSLFFGAYYFQNDKFYSKAKQLLLSQLKEQILADGAHFERSPMYHQIILFRLLDTINLVRNNAWKANEFLPELRKIAASMLSWLTNITFKNGQIPRLKDATKGIAPTTKELMEYAQLLEIEWKSINVTLSDSGYRMMENEKVELIVDVGEVSPSYQPGHAHADELNFVLNVDNKPLIVDVGISTYEKNKRRQLERSTISHNCISLDNINSSVVWGGFRVAKRAKVNVLLDSAFEIQAEHTGFKSRGLAVQRKFILKENSICIHDILSGSSSIIDYAVSLIHFHPDVLLEVSGNDIFADKMRIKLSGFRSFTIENYEYAYGFNRLRKAQKLVLKPSETNQVEFHYAD